ncbi:MAG: hypothetical protein WC854_02400 [Bacteroidales bacterium]
MNIFAKKAWYLEWFTWEPVFFAFDCVEVKMKNPETEAISGFCCKLHFHSAEKEGLF